MLAVKSRIWKRMLEVSVMNRCVIVDVLHTGTISLAHHDAILNAYVRSLMLFVSQRVSTPAAVMPNVPLRRNNEPRLITVEGTISIFCVSSAQTEKISLSITVDHLLAHLSQNPQMCSSLLKRKSQILVRIRLLFSRKPRQYPQQSFIAS